MRVLVCQAPALDPEREGQVVGAAVRLPQGDRDLALAATMLTQMMNQSIKIGRIHQPEAREWWVEDRVDA